MIASFESPKNKKQLQQLLGVCNYYRQFTERHCELINPFRNLLKGKVTLNWTSGHEQSFMKIKKGICLNVYNLVIIFQVCLINYKLTPRISELVGFCSNMTVMVISE